MHTYLNLACLKVGRNFTFVAAFGGNHFAQNRVQIRHLHRHLLPGAQVVDKLLDDSVTLFDILVDGLCKITILLAHHLCCQPDTRQRGAKVMADPCHQQRTVVRQLFNACRHVVKRTRYRAHFRCAILAQRRWDNTFTDLQCRMLQVDQRSVLDTNKQPCAADGQQHDRQGVSEQRREVALMNLGERNTHPNVG